MSLSSWVLLLILSFLWGGSFFLTEIALLEVSALFTVWARVGLAAVFLIPLVFINKLPFPTELKLWKAFFVMGLLNNALPFSMIVWGQTQLSGSLAAIFNATTPLFTILIAHVMTRDEKLSWPKMAGILLGFMGVVIMVGKEAFGGIDQSVLAMIAILSAAISYGCAALWGRRFRETPPMVTAMGQVTCSTLIMTPAALFIGMPDGFIVPSQNVVLALGGLAVLSTVLAYILYFKILKMAGASNLMLVTFLIPLSAVLLGSVFLGERLESDQIIGMGLILSGLLIIDGRVLPKRKPA